MRRVLLILLLAMMPTTSRVQSATDRDAVLKAVEIFFDSMTARDVERAGTILVPGGRFHAIDMRTPKRASSSFSTDEYLARLEQSKHTNRERIWKPEVRVHGAIATVWAPYDFWTDGKFSHCGIDAFDLIRTEEAWKIAGGAFTVEAKCEPSPLGPLKRP